MMNHKFTSMIDNQVEFTMKRGLVFANIFNLLIGVYLIIIAIVSLIHLRWYHQLTVSLRVRHIVTSSTSYSAFIIIIIESLILILIFITSAGKLTSKIYIRNNTPSQQQQNETGNNNNNNNNIGSSHQESVNLTTITTITPNESGSTHSFDIPQQHQTQVKTQARLDPSSSPSPSHGLNTRHHQQKLKFGQQASLIERRETSASISGELVRDSISGQLESAFAKYQFANRSNHYSVAIDAMQDINYCCGTLDYTDFPHQRISGLSSGHYPGSCCGKHIFGVNARVICVPEEIIKAKQTSGCVQVLSGFYDLISILVVPAALVCLFVSITTIALMSISRGETSHHIRASSGSSIVARNRSRPELRSYF